MDNNNNYGNGGNGGNDFFVILVTLFFFILLIGSCGGGGYYYYYYIKHPSCARGINQESIGNMNNPDTNYNNDLNKVETFADTSSSNNYNPLYTNKYIYTQPPGNTDAQRHAGSGQGTKGEFLPLQGKGAQVYMKNTAENNKLLPTPTKGKIGGQPNYTTKPETSAWIGFNSFPYNPDDPMIENSYTIDGANQRVLNPGQRGNLPAPDWWPTVKKNNKGYAVQGSDLLVTCTAPINQNINTCEEGKNFVIYKNMTQAERLMNNV